MNNNATMTMEQFEELVKHLPEGTDKKKIAKALGIQLPVEIKSIDDQLQQATIVKYATKKTKKNPNPIESEYVAIPSIRIDQSTGARGFYVRTSVARAIAKKLLDICDKNNL